MKLKCKGITSIIDKDDAADVKRDINGRFYIMPRKLADKIARQTGVPLHIEHSDK